MRLADLIGSRHTPSSPPLDRLLALSAARARFQSELGLAPRGDSAVVLHPMPNGDFRQIVGRAETVAAQRTPDGDTLIESSNDPYAFRWLILRNTSFEALVAGIHAISGALQARWEQKLLCAVFPFEDEHRRPVYWVYNYRWGAFYPIAPAAGNHHREAERERLLNAQLGPDLTVEPEQGVWFPLWEIPI